MQTFIARVLRLLVPDVFEIRVNDEVVGTVSLLNSAASGEPADWIAQPADNMPHVDAEIASTAKAAAEMLCDRLERAIDDFRFEIGEMDEDGYRRVTRIALGSGRVLDDFSTTDDPYLAVEAAREAQAFTLEERFEMYAERGW